MMPDQAPVKAPALSVVVVVQDMAREAPRTLLSLSVGYQRRIAADAYEVIIVDNGSDPPLDPAVLSGLPGTFRLIRVDPASPSPAQAANRGLAAARGDVIGLLVDGARIVTPGLLHHARAGARLHERSVVATLGWHLGLDTIQSYATEAGFDAAREDALLARIDWPAEGYRLFEVGALDGSSVDGWFGPLQESNALFMRREMWDALGGVDERFDMPGGGFLAPDLLRRALELPRARLMVLLGESTFHQVHGATSTNATTEERPSRLDAWRAQYEVIRGKPWEAPSPRDRTYLGSLPQAMLPHLVRSVVTPVSGRGPLGRGFDQSTWSLRRPVVPASPQAAALVKLAHAELKEGRQAAAAAVSRLARSIAPDEPEPQRLLSVTSAWLRGTAASAERAEEVHCALGEAYALLEDREAAEREFGAALALDGTLGRAHSGLSRVRLPGTGYAKWLERLHGLLRPGVYLEIGVAQGRTIALARPPTIAIGVDPEPSLVVKASTTTHLCVETSDAFFARDGVSALVGDRRVDFAFIDGLHTFDQALRDFVNVETCSTPRSVIVLHDTLPLDEPTQRRVRETPFWTGDTWKMVLCLREWRPDLEVFTIATPPSGLTMVLGLDPGSAVLREGFDDAVDRYMDAPFSRIARSMAPDLNIVANDWDAVVARLQARGIVEA